MVLYSDVLFSALILIIGFGEGEYWYLGIWSEFVGIRL